MKRCCFCAADGTSTFSFGDYGSRYTFLCLECLESTKNLISLTNKHLDKPNPPPTLDKALEDALESINYLNTKIVYMAEDKLTLLNELAGAFTNQIQIDIMVKPGDNGPAIPAHKVILAARSGIIKNMLESDGCKAPAGDSITLPDLRKELQAFLQFLYSGQLAEEQVEKHCYSLLRAAHKYEVSSLENLCGRKICKSLGRNNVLEVLEFACTYSAGSVIDAAIDFIIQNRRDIIFSPEYQAFANKNAHLSLRVTKAFVNKSLD